MVTYGVSQKAIAYPVQMPPDFDGNPYALSTPQISLALKVFCQRSLLHVGTDALTPDIDSVGFRFAVPPGAGKC